MNILYITPPHIGDSIMTSGILDYLIKKYKPEREKIWVCTPPTVAALYQSAPVRIYPLKVPFGPQRAACNAISYPIKKIAQSLSKRMAMLKLIWHARAIQWDMVVDLMYTPSRLLYALTYNQMYNIRLCEKKLKQKILNVVHHVQYGASIMGLDHVQMPRVWLSDADRQRAAENIPLGTPLLAVCPTASQRWKEWPIRYFSELIFMLTRKGGDLEDYFIFLTGAQSDREQCRMLFETIPHNRIIDGFGMPLGQTAAVLERSKLFIGNDSGLTHVAAALGTLTLGLFGPTNEELWMPFGIRAHTLRYDLNYKDALARASRQKFSKYSDQLMKDLHPPFVSKTITHLLKEDAKIIPFANNRYE